jgi:hypothetical protein
MCFAFLDGANVQGQLKGEVSPVLSYCEVERF